MKLATLALAAIALFGVQVGSDAPAPVAEIGKSIPTFRLNDHTGQIQTIGGKSELWTVIAFYPKALTPG